MLRLRIPACAIVSAGIAFDAAAGVADAGAGVILSAICAMKVPSPIMIAAKIIMLRMTPHPIRGTADMIMPAGKLRPTVPGAGCNFGEKDERSVNGRPSYAGLIRVSIDLQKQSLR